MTGVQAQKDHAIARLKRLAATGDLPAKAQARCDKFVEKLPAPVRVGVFGLPGAGKRDALNSILGQRVLHSTDPAVTMQLVPGDAPSTTLMHPDGTEIESSGYPSAELLSGEVIFATVCCPICQRDGRSYLLVACDATQTDILAALGWAASRVDLAIWCTRDWSELEAQSWASAPDPLKDHAILMHRGVSGLPAVDGFEYVVQPGAEENPLPGVLRSIIDEAVTQDILAVEMFLRRYAPEDAQVEPAFDVAPFAANENYPTEEARAELGYLFQHVRNAATGMLQSPFLDQDASSEQLEAFEDVFQTLADHIIDMDAAAEAWPDMEPMLEEARDFALLLRMETGADQATDAAMLLLQLRMDMEEKLAA